MGPGCWGRRAELWAVSGTRIPSATAPTMKPITTLRPLCDEPIGRRRGRGVDPFDSSSLEMTWTSMSLASRRTALMTDPRVHSAQRERWLVPSTSWVA